MEHDKLKPPEKDFANKLHEYFNQIAKSLTGSLINPLIDIVLPSFHQKRFEEWCTNVYNELLELEDKKITLNDLQKNYEFISILKESMIIASKSHQQEKLQLIRNGLLNSLDCNINFDKKILYTKLIDNLGLTHHIVLKILNNNLRSFKDLDSYDRILDMLLKYREDLNINKDELIYILNDLNRNGLIKTSRHIKDNKQIVREGATLIDSSGDPNLPYINVTEFAKKYIEYVFES